MSISDTQEADFDPPPLLMIHVKHFFGTKVLTFIFLSFCVIMCIE
nr:MAG TPA: hypothetical protein [Caudoviricetes sp.]